MQVDFLSRVQKNRKQRYLGDWLVWQTVVTNKKGLKARDSRLVAQGSWFETCGSRLVAQDLWLKARSSRLVAHSISWLQIFDSRLVVQDMWPKARG